MRASSRRSHHSIRPAEMSAQHDALGLELQQRGVGLALVDAQRDGELARGGGSEDGGASAQELDDGVFAGPGAFSRRRSCDAVASIRGSRATRADAPRRSTIIECGGRRRSASRDVGANAESAALPCALATTSIRERAIHLVVEKEPRRQQRVVQLVRVAGVGTLLVAHARDRGGVERAELRDLAAAAREHGLRAALFERCVVEERVRLAR